MDWAGIEGIVYSEEDHPEKLLGAHKVKGGFLVQKGFPETPECEKIHSYGNGR